MTSAEMLSYLLQTSLAVSVLIGLVLVARQYVAKAFGAKATYTLWALPIVRLVMPPVPVGWSLFGLFPTTPEVGLTAAPIAGIAPVLSPVAAIPPLPAGDRVALPEADLIAPMAQSGMDLGRLATLAFQPSTLLTVWLIGAVIALSRSSLTQLVFSRIVDAEGTPASPALQTEALETCQMIGLDPHKVSVERSFISDSPFVTGLFRPVVVVPAWFETDYSREERQIALMHELTHIKRRDLWALQMSSLATALQWFNPLLYLANHAFRSDQEAACDADVLGAGVSTPHAYGSVLMKAARKSRPEAKPKLATSLALTHSLKERLEHMRNPLPSLRRRLLGSALTLGLGSALLLASATAQTADPAEAEKAETDFRVFSFEHMDERMVLLENPIDDVELDLKAIEELTAEIDIESERLAEIIENEVLALNDEISTAVGDLSVSFISEGDFVKLGGEGELPAEIMNFVGDVMRLASKGEAGEAEIEALTDVFEERMDAWAETLEARVEAMEPEWETRIEAHAERWSDTMEARIEAKADRIEARADEIEQHAEKMERAAELIETLTESCEDAVALETISATHPETGRSYRAICLGDASAQSPDEIIAELRASGSFSDAELGRVEKRLQNPETHRWTFSFGSDEDEGED